MVRISRFLQWIWIGVLLFSLGASIAWFHRIGEDQEATAEQSRMLMTLASAAAKLLDGDTHQSFDDPRDMQSTAFNAELAKLAAFGKAHTDISFVYTLRPAGESWEFVLDPTPPGDEDKDGIEDRSMLLDPYDEITPAATKSYYQAESTAESEPASDQWGTFYSAFAPIVNGKGQVVGIVGVDFADKVLQKKFQENWREFWNILAGSFAAAFLVSFIITQLLSGNTAYEPDHELDDNASDPKPLRKELLVITVILVAGTLVGACFLGLRPTPTNVSGETSLGELRTWLTKAKQSSEFSHSDAAALEAKATNMGLHLPEAEPDALRLTPQQRLSHLENDLSLAESRHSRKLVQQFEASEAARRIVTGLTALASLVAGGCIIGLWRASEQRAWVLRAAADNRQIRRNLSHLKQHIPLGCFQIRNGRCEKPNLAALRMLGLKDAAEFDSTLRCTLHPDDALVLGEGIDRNPTERTHQVRLVGGKSLPKTVELHITPIYRHNGKLKFLLCFLKDVDSLIQANNRLRDQQAYIESTSRQLRITFDELVLSFDQTVEAFVRALEAKDPHIASHCRRTARWATALAQAMDLSLDKVQTIEHGCLLHDIGMLSIPDELLAMPEDGPPEDEARLRSHPLVGAYLLSDLARCKQFMPIIRSHHENLDGTGYPDGLSGDAIPVEVRIAAVADRFDTLHYARDAEECNDMQETLRQLRDQVEKNWLDGRIVELLTDMINEGTLEVPSSAQKAA